MAFLSTWTFAADGNGTAFVLTHRSPFEMVCYGTFGSGTVTAQFSPDGGTTWIDVAGVSVAANGKVVLGGAPGDSFRPVLTGSSSPSLTVVLRESVAS